MNIIWNINRFTVEVKIENIKIMNFKKSDLIPLEIENCKNWRLSSKNNSEFGVFTATWEKRKIKDLMKAKSLILEKYKNLISTY